MASAEKQLGGGKKKPAKKSSKSKKKIRRMTIEPSDNGGHVIRHEFQPDDPEDGMSQTPPDEVHAMGDSDQMLQHVQSQLGGQLPPQGGGDPGAGAAPQGGM